MEIKLIEVQFVYYFKPNPILINDTIKLYNKITEFIFQDIRAVKLNNLFPPFPDQPIMHIIDTKNNILQFQQLQPEQQRCDLFFKEKDINGNFFIDKFKKICNKINELLLGQQFVIDRVGAIATFENLDFTNSDSFLNDIGAKSFFNNVNMFNLLFEEIIELGDKQISKYTRFVKAERNRFIIQKDFNSGINNNQLSKEFITKFKEKIFNEILKREWPK